MLGQLAHQFGQAIGNYGALRDAIGRFDKEKNAWIPATPKSTDYENATEAHDRGAVLVAAVFDAFLNIYRRRSADLIRLATGGTGILGEGDIPRDLVNRLAQEASKTAGQVLNMCIRALDYCPPVDLKFGEYVRALITADRDLVPEDKWGYRPAFIQAFRRRGIYPENVRNLSSESLCWERRKPTYPLRDSLQSYNSVGTCMWTAGKPSKYHRRTASTHEWLKNDRNIGDADTEALGFYRSEGSTLTVNGKSGRLGKL